MIRINIFFINLLACSLLLGCSGDNAPETKEQPKQVNANEAAQPGQAVGQEVPVQPGKLIKKVLLPGNSGQSIAYYVPAGEAPLPVLVFIDSHGRGYLPLEKYKHLADEYGFAMIGSNFIENGLDYPKVQSHFQQVMDFTRNKFPGIENRIYTVGFSGGARYAPWLAFDFGLKATVACAAGLPQGGKEKISDMYYYGLVGNRDFNYNELVDLKETFVDLGFHFVDIYPGKHEWPPDSVFEYPLKWLTIKEMLMGHRSTDEQLVGQWYKNYKNGGATDPKDLQQQMNYQERGIALFSGLKPIDGFRQELESLKKSKRHKNWDRKHALGKYLDKRWKNTFTNGFSHKEPMTWWNPTYRKFNTEWEENSNISVKQAYARADAYLSLLGYAYTNQALKSDSLSNAGLYLDVFKMADPGNADVYYLEALLALKQGNNEKALSSLEKLPELNFQQPAQLQTNPAFDPVRNDARFVEVMANL